MRKGPLPSGQGRVCFLRAGLRKGQGSRGLLCTNVENLTGKKSDTSRALDLLPEANRRSTDRQEAWRLGRKREMARTVWLGMDEQEEKGRQ